MTPPFAGCGRPVLRALAGLPGMVRSARLQINNAPSLLLARAGAVLQHDSPILMNLYKICEEMLGLMQAGTGLIETMKISDCSAHIALIAQRVFSIKIEESARFGFSLPQMMVALKRAAAGMEEGRTYRYTLHQGIVSPITLELVKQGTQVSVSRAA
ncbi:MAG: hypothetical protein JW782_02785 [Candidatus Saganbacteria bacterium]|nr:hypothetical protein [Candidatus Saganbacteria bacterium]